MVKISRDAELDFDDDISKSFLDKIAQSVKERSSAEPVRFVYDSEIRLDTLNFLLKQMGINNKTDSIIPGGKYHNRRDYMDFPNLHTDLVYEPMQPLNVKGFSHSDNTFDKLKEKDFKKLLLTHYSFLKRPVLLLNSKIYIGNSKKNVRKAEIELNKK